MAEAKERETILREQSKLTEAEYALKERERELGRQPFRVSSAPGGWPGGGAGHGLN